MKKSKKGHHSWKWKPQEWKVKEQEKAGKKNNYWSNKEKLN